MNDWRATSCEDVNQMNCSQSR